MKKLVIFGAGFFDVLKLIDAINREQHCYNLKGFIDDDERLGESNFETYPVLGTRRIIPNLVRAGVSFFNNVSTDTSTIKGIGDLLDSSGCEVVSLVHPAIDLKYVSLGRGCILPEGCLVGGRTRIGNYVIVRLGVLISHDVTIEDYVFIGPGAVIGGNAVLKSGCLIGAGATIMSQRTVGENSVVGAGAVVTKDVTPGTTVVGVPARIVQEA